MKPTMTDAAQQFAQDAALLEVVDQLEAWALLRLGQEAAPVALIGAALRLWEAEGGKSHALAMATITMNRMLDAKQDAPEWHRSAPVAV